MKNIETSKEFHFRCFPSAFMKVFRKKKHRNKCEIPFSMIYRCISGRIQVKKGFRKKKIKSQELWRDNFVLLDESE